MCWRGGALVLCLLQALHGWGEAVFELEPYTVEATRVERDWLEVPYGLASISKARIQQANRQVTLDESLSGAPGVFILNPYNYAQDTRISIRGFGARSDFGIRGIRLLVDGIPATTPDGQGEVDGLDLGSARSIEVLRGPSSFLYGAASGGVILVHTEDFPETPFLESRLTAGDDAFLHSQIKTGGHGYLLSAGHLESDGYRRHSETEQRRFNGKWDQEFGQQKRLRLVLNVIDYPLQNDPGGLTREEAAGNPRQARERNILFDSGEAVSQQRIGLQYENVFNKGQTLDVAAHYTHRDFSNKLPFRDGGQVTFERHFYGTRIQYSREGERSLFSIGADVDIQNDDRRNFDNLEGSRGPVSIHQSEEVESLGLYGIFEYELSESFRFSAALRRDRVAFDVEDRLLADGDDSGSLDFIETSPGVAVTWNPAEKVLLYANVARSFETPTTTEFDNPDGAGFNTALEAQAARSIELGFKGIVVERHYSVRVNASVFRMRIEDALVPYELAAFPGREFYRNAGRSSRDGLELAVESRFGAGFRVRLDYTWSDFRYDRFLAESEDYSDNRLPGIPEHFGGVEVRYDGAEGFYASWKTRLIGGFYADDGNSERIHGYLHTNLRAGWRIPLKRWEIEPFLGINNLFDSGYYANIRINAFGGRYFEPAPRRSVFGGIRVKWFFE